MVDGEILGQADVNGDFLRPRALRGRDDVEDLRADETTEEFEGVLFERLLFGRRFVAVVNERFERCATILDRAGKHVEQRVVVDGETGNERLGRRDLELGEGGLVPMDVAFSGGLRFSKLFFLFAVALAARRRFSMTCSGAWATT